jgi:hypothetical protein
MVVITWDVCCILIVVIKGKGKVVVPIHAMKEYRMSGCMAPLVLKLGTR